MSISTLNRQHTGSTGPRGLPFGLCYRIPLIRRVMFLQDVFAPEHFQSSPKSTGSTSGLPVTSRSYEQTKKHPLEKQRFHPKKKSILSGQKHPKTRTNHGLKIFRYQKLVKNTSFWWQIHTKTHLLMLLDWLIGLPKLLSFAKPNNPWTHALSQPQWRWAPHTWWPRWLAALGVVLLGQFLPKNQTKGGVLGRFCDAFHMFSRVLWRFSSLEAISCGFRWSADSMCNQKWLQIFPQAAHLSSPVHLSGLPDSRTTSYQWWLSAMGKNRTGVSGRKTLRRILDLPSRPTFKSNKSDFNPVSHVLCCFVVVFFRPKLNTSWQ